MTKPTVPHCCYCDRSLCCAGCGREQPEDDVTALRAFVREIAAIDPLAGGGDAKYFVTADFVARACALADR